MDMRLEWVISGVIELVFMGAFWLKRGPGRYLMEGGARPASSAGTLGGRART
jgi:hypothetical protein